MKIQATPRNRAGELALSVFTETLRQVRGDRLVTQLVRLEASCLHIGDSDFDLKSYGRVIVAGAGKASASMALGLEQILGEQIADGLIVTKYGHEEPLRRCRVLEAGHPVPDENSLKAGEEMLALARSATETDLVLFVLSGGASALLESPIESVSLEDLRTVNRELLNSGAKIGAVNAVRSRLSEIKAGGLAKAFCKATVAVLYLSDVEGDVLASIGSGPFVPPQRLRDLDALLQSLSLTDRFPAHLREALSERELPTKEVEQPPHFMAGNSFTLSEEALKAAHTMGVQALAIPMRGEAKDFPYLLREHGLLPDVGHSGIHGLIGVGEPVATVKGGGLGGRAQEMACAFANLIQGKNDYAVLAAGSDGTDGPTDAAGALVDGQTVARALKEGVTVDRTLEDNDSYHFHKAAGTLITTGPTGTNLNDILIVVRA